MIIRTVSVLIIVAIFIPLTFSSVEESQRLYLKLVRCNVSDKFIYPNFTCYAKSFNRTCSTGTVIGTAKMPISVAHVEIRLLYKYGVIYREVMHTPRYEWCSLMKQGNDNPMVSQILKVVEDSAPQIIHQCPYTGIFVKHQTLKLNTLASIFPSGDYRMIMDLWTGKNEPMVTVLSAGSVISTNKDTFG